jgi:hypothetical protein
MVKAHLRRAQEDTTQATQALTQVQGVLVEQRSAAEEKNLALQVQWDKEKEELQQRQGEVDRRETRIKELVNRALRSVTFIEVQTEE